MPEPFKQSEQAFSATAQTVVIGIDDEYDPNILDNPVRKKINESLASVNLYQWRNCGGYSGR